MLANNLLSEDTDRLIELYYDRTTPEHSDKSLIDRHTIVGCVVFHLSRSFCFCLCVCLRVCVCVYVCMRVCVCDGAFVLYRNLRASIYVPMCLCVCISHFHAFSFLLIKWHTSLPVSGSSSGGTAGPCKGDQRR